MDFLKEYIKGYSTGYVIQTLMNHFNSARALRTMPRNAPDEIFVECRDVTDTKRGDLDAGDKI